MQRKLFITLILLLFLLPFVSWYYLQQGLNWRKEAQDVMNGTQPFPQGEWIDIYGKKLSSANLAENVTLVSQMSCVDSADVIATLYKFYEQFRETRKATFIILDSCQSNDYRGDSTKMNWYHFSCQDSFGLCQLLKGSWPEGKTHALVDKRMVIRSYYGSTTEEEKRILLEHMALLLPRDRSEKVELKRGKNK